MSSECCALAGCDTRDVTVNHIGDIGAEHIARALEKNTAITSIGLLRSCAICLAALSLIWLTLFLTPTVSHIGFFKRSKLSKLCEKEGIEIDIWSSSDE